MITKHRIVPNLHLKKTIHLTFTLTTRIPDAATHAGKFSFSPSLSLFKAGNELLNKPMSENSERKMELIEETSIQDQERLHNLHEC
jgi:hypothetical protein